MMFGRDTSVAQDQASPVFWSHPPTPASADACRSALDVDGDNRRFSFPANEYQLAFPVHDDAEVRLPPILSSNSPSPFALDSVDDSRSFDATYQPSTPSHVSHSGLVPPHCKVGKIPSDCLPYVEVTGTGAVICRICRKAQWAALKSDSNMRNHLVAHHNVPGITAQPQLERRETKRKNNQSERANPIAMPILSPTCRSAVKAVPCLR
jgi:hypothetical protein